LGFACGVGIACVAAAQTPQRLPVGPPSGASLKQKDLGKPYVTTCLVSAAAPDSVSQTRGSGPAAGSPELRGTIEEACGNGISSVNVILGDRNRATVRFTAPSEAEAQRFWNIIQALPELHSYSLDADVNLKK
jgi:hypothetical protein